MKPTLLLVHALALGLALAGLVPTAAQAEPTSPDADPTSPEAVVLQAVVDAPTMTPVELPPDLTALPLEDFSYRVTQCRDRSDCPCPSLCGCAARGDGTEKVCLCFLSCNG